MPTMGLGLMVSVAGLGIATATTNPGTTFAAVLSLILIVRLLWRPGLPPVLLFICGMQWLQGAVMAFHADVFGVELRTMTYARHIDEATYYTLGWVSMIAVGAAFATRNLTAVGSAATHGMSLSLPRLIAIYAVWTVVVRVLEVAIPGQAQQIVGALETLRWAFVYALFALGWSLGRGRMIVLGILTAEVAFGFLSFFSNFKTPLYLFAIALVSSGYRPTLRQYFVLAIVFAATLYFGVVWSSIKREYRNELSGGLGASSQVVVLSPEERFDVFVDLVGSVDARMLEEGAESLVTRIAYVEYFAYVLGYVPRVEPHQDGGIWANAFAHVFLPRVLFPDKAALESDTVIAERYTGLDLGAGTGTSITIGLPAETYVDLGPVVMFIVPLLLGLMYGSVYRYFLRRREAGVMAQGVAVAMHVGMSSVGPAATKVLGGYLALLVITLVLWRLGWPVLERALRAQHR